MNSPIPHPTVPSPSPGRAGLVFLLICGFAACSAHPLDEPIPEALADAESARDGVALRSDCDAGDIEACYRLGLLYAGDSVSVARERGAGDRDIEALWRNAARRLEEACLEGEGFAQACSVLGDLSMAGLGTRQDEARAVALYRAACDRGSSDACNHLGDAYAHGISVEENEETAIDFFLKGCEADPPSYTACFRAAARLQSTARSDADDPALSLLPEVRELYDEACSGGSPLACLNMAFEREEELERRLENDPTQARDPDFLRVRDDSVVAVYRDVCDRGEPLGCNNLGAVLVSGSLGLGSNRELAQELYDHACREGRLALACNNLAGTLLADADTASALGYWWDGCTLGEGASCGDYHYYGRRMEVEGVVIQSLIGCAFQSGLSCNNAGVEFEEERGLPLQAPGGGIAPGLDVAILLYRRACRLGNGMGCRNLSRNFANRGESGLQTYYRDRACELDASLDICQPEPPEPPERPERLGDTGLVAGALPDDLPVLQPDTRVEGTLEEGRFLDPWIFHGSEGETTEFYMGSGEVDAYLYLFSGTSGELVEFDDDGGVDRDSFFELTLPETGIYVVVAGSFGRNETGTYELAHGEAAVLMREEREP